MELADKAMIARVKGDETVATEMYKKAYHLEKEAVLKMEPETEIPVPYPVLVRGAAALAYHAGLFDEANQMIAQCFALNPPAFVINELNELKALMKIDGKKKNLRIKGKLTSANEAEITIVEEISSKQYSIHVPAEKLKEVVKKFFLETVFIQATTSPKGGIFLQKITKAA